MILTLEATITLYFMDVSKLPSLTSSAYHFEVKATRGRLGYLPGWKENRITTAMGRKRNTKAMAT
jgi:hypothetical protein